jgi:tetratricopeptide (TPR) repeat protein
MESPSLLLRSLIGRMAVWYEWSRWSEAEEAARNVLQIIEQYQQGERWQPYALLPLAVIAYQTGDQERGDDYTRQYKRMIDRYGPNSELIALEPFLYLTREDWIRAFTDFKEKLQRSEPFPALDVLTQYAELAVITGENVGEQRALCERAITVTEQSGNRKSFANALRARGRMHLEQENWAAAEQDLQQALRICEELDIRWERGQTLYCLGLYYRRRTDALNKENVALHTADRGRAHRYFEQALGFFESLKAVHDLERTRVALAQDSNARV